MSKRLKNIEDKNEEQSKLLSNANKTSSYIKNECDYNYDNNKFAFYKFPRDFQNFKGYWSLNTMIHASFTGL